VSLQLLIADAGLLFQVQPVSSLSRPQLVSNMPHDEEISLSDSEGHGQITDGASDDGECPTECSRSVTARDCAPSSLDTLMGIYGPLPLGIFELQRLRLTIYCGSKVP
jgi:hypothetical protein